MTSADRNARIPNAKLHFSNGYYLDFDSLARLINLVDRMGQSTITRSDLSSAMGVADIRVKYISGFCQAFGLMEVKTFRLTELGHTVINHDPYLEDTGTLWFLHYIVSSDPRILVWNRIVTQILPTRRYLSREEAKQAFSDTFAWLSEDSIRKHITKEINVFIDAYINQRLTRLAYLRAEGVDRFTLGYREPVPPLVLAAAVGRFRDKHRSSDTAIPVLDLLTAPNSPGVVFQLDEGRLRASLEQLKMQPGLSLESRADLDQIRLTDNTPDYVWMERYFANR